MPVPDAWLALNAAPGIGPARFHLLLKAFPRLEDALGAGAARLAARMPSLGVAGAEAMLRGCEGFDPAAEREAAARLDVRLLGFRDEDYPKRLLAVPSPPPLLYVRGSLPPDAVAAVAVVGTRAPTAYGLQAAGRLAADLAHAGVAVVSGLARGIDAAAHGACVDAGGATLACLGNGLASVYPAENSALAARIVERGGALLSQFPLAAKPARMHFPMRNAVIAGLSQGVLVVEGEQDSGSLITADQALDFGRDVYAVPGPIDAPMSRGPLALLAEGAKLVRGVQDILDELGGAFAPRPRRRRAEAGMDLGPAQPELPLAVDDPGQLRLLKALEAGGVLALDELGSRSGLDAAAVGAAAVELEILGAVRQVAGGRYALARAQA